MAAFLVDNLASLMLKYISKYVAMNGKSTEIQSFQRARASG